MDDLVRGSLPSKMSPLSNVSKWLSGHMMILPNPPLNLRLTQAPLPPSEQTMMKPFTTFVCLASIALGACSQGEKTTLTYPDGIKKAAGLLNHHGAKDGHWTYWYRNGQRSLEGEYTAGREEGIWIAWHENGNKSLEGELKAGKKDGNWTRWHENGQKHSEGDYKDGKKEGNWTSWDNSGKKESERVWKNNVGYPVDLPRGAKGSAAAFTYTLR